MKFEGVFTAMVTPFTGGADGVETVDFEALKGIVEAQIAGGVAGVVPVGTTGESPTLSKDEKKAVIKCVVDTVAGRCAVIAGTGSNNTAESVAMTAWAKEAGVDACLLVNPYYNKPTQEGLVAHVAKVAEVGLPIVLYNVPGRTGIIMQPATVARIYKECAPHVCAIKDATGSMDNATEVATLCDIPILSGDDSMTVPLLSIGGAGVISVVSNFMPEALVAMVKAGQAGDFVTARKAHLALFGMCKACFCETNPIPVKEAMGLLGYCSAATRLPLSPIGAGSKERLIGALKEAGVSGPKPSF